MLSRTTRTLLGTLAAVMLAFAVDGAIIYVVNLPKQAEPQSFSITPGHATTIALDHARDATVIGEPRLIAYGDTHAYKVILDRGMIYVEASTGRVLANTSKAPTAGSP